MNIYVDNKYVKDHYYPHIIQGQHFEDYLEQLKSILSKDLNLATEYLILYDQLAYSTLKISTYSRSDWNIDENIIPDKIKNIFIYTNPDSISVTNQSKKFLDELNLPATFLNELYIEYLWYRSLIENNNVKVNLDSYQITISCFIMREWEYQLFLKRKSLLST
jgi:hypothetical protein